jgi:hypothetical protein
MNLRRLPIPNEYIYIDTDKIVSLEFDAYDGKLIICLHGELNRIVYDGAKRVLDYLLDVTECRDGIPSIAKTAKKEHEPVKQHIYCEANDICDLIT